MYHSYMKEPIVSVLIPTYNKAEFLGEAIESVLNQTFKDFELIIVDDCSKDNTDDVVKRYQDDCRVKYFKNVKNLGIGGNWNKTLGLATGKYIKFLMGDDKFEPELLEKYVSVMENNPNVSLVTSYRGVFGDRKSIIKQPLEGLIESKKAIELILKHGNWIGEPTTVMFRRENLWLGNFKVELKFLLDIDMWVRHLSCGDLYVIPEVLSWFRQYSGQYTKEVKKHFGDIFEWYYLLEMVFYDRKRYFINEIKDAEKLKKKSFIKHYKRISSMIKSGNLKLVLECMRIAKKENIFLPFLIKSFLYSLKTLWRFNGD